MSFTIEEVKELPVAKTELPDYKDLLISILKFTNVLGDCTTLTTTQEKIGFRLRYS